MRFEDTYLGRLRQTVGSSLILVPGAIVIVLDADGRVLLGHRSDTGLWGLPAGHAEAGESFRSTAVTELREEAGLEADDDDLLAFASISEPEVQWYTYPNGHEIHSFAMCFVVHHWSGDIRADGDEMLDVRFFDRAALPNMTRPAALALTLFDEFTKTGQFQAR